MCKECEKLVKTENIGTFEDPKVVALYNDLEKAVFDYQDHVMKEVLATYETQTDIFKTQESEDFFDLIANLLESIYIYGQGVGLKLVKDETKELEAIASLDFNLSFDIAPTRAKDYSSSQTGILIKNIDDSTQAEVQKIVTKSISEGWTQSKLAQVINDSFAQYNKVRSQLIAQQETALALGGGKYNQFKESASAYMQKGRKRSYTMQDGNVREDHNANANAGWIPADDEFPGTGGQHEPFGFRCRCAVTYRVFLPSEL